MRRRVTVLVLCVCVCVCVCVCTPAPTTLVSTLKMGYVGVYLRLFLLVWIFDKSFRSKVMTRKSQYANEQLPLATGFSPFRVPCIDQKVPTGGTLGKRSLFSPLCTSWMRLLLVFTYQGRVRPYCSERALAFSVDGSF